MDPLRYAGVILHPLVGPLIAATAVAAEVVDDGRAAAGLDRVGGIGCQDIAPIVVIKVADRDIGQTVLLQQLVVHLVISLTQRPALRPGQVADRRLSGFAPQGHAAAGHGGTGAEQHRCEDNATVRHQCGPQGNAAVGEAVHIPLDVIFRREISCIILPELPTRRVEVLIAHLLRGRGIPNHGVGVIFQHKQQLPLQPATQFVDGNALLFAEPVRHRCLRRVKASGAEVVVRAIGGVKGAEQQIHIGQGILPGNSVYGIPHRQQGGDLRIGEQ